MQDRSFGTIVLAFTSVMVALHAQIGAVALILGGSVFATYGSVPGAVALLLGAGYLGLTFAAYAVAFGAWTRKHWAWAGGMVVFGALSVATVLLVVISGNLMAAPLPVIGTIVGFGLLQRPAVKADLLGTEVPAKAPVPASDGMEAHAAH